MSEMGAYLEEFVDQDAGLVDHCEIQRAPVLKEGEIE